MQLLMSQRQTVPASSSGMKWRKVLQNVANHLPDYNVL